MVSRRAVILFSSIVAAALAAATWRSVQASGARLEKASLVEAWTLEAPGVTTMVPTRLQPGTEPVLVLQGAGFVMIAGADGKIGPRKAFPGLAVAATGDVNGDGADEVLIATGSPATVQALDARLEPLWSSGPLAGMGAAARLAPADLDRDDRREVLVGDGVGRIAALSAAGKPLWTWSFQGRSGKDTDAVRGLDDQRLGAERRVVAARRSGEIAVFGADGKLLWEDRLASGIRRLRLIDLDGDKGPEILVGTEDGSSVLRAKGEAQSLTAGEAITEIRRIETDGNPATTEVAVGGKRGGVLWIAGGRPVAMASVAGKVSEVAGVDLTGDGRDELLVGTEEGAFSVFDPSARLIVTQRAGGKVDRIASVVSPLRERLAVVAAGPTVKAYRLRTLAAPAWYTPLGAGALGLLALAIVAGTLLFASQPGGAPRAPAAALEASLAKVNALIARGAISPAAAADRVAQIRRELARPRTPPPAAPPPPRLSPPPPPRKTGA